MARKIISVGTVGNDGTGDDLRTGGQKINDNFQELYSIVTGLQIGTGGANTVAGIGFSQGGIMFDGATQDSFQTNTILNAVDPTGTNIIAVPDSSGIVALMSDVRIARDSAIASVLATVDSDYVAARQRVFLDSALAALEFLDSAEAQGIIDSNFLNVSSNIIPTDSSHELGSSSIRWGKAYIGKDGIDITGDIATDSARITGVHSLTIQNLKIDRVGTLLRVEDSAGTYRTLGNMDSGAVQSIIDNNPAGSVANFQMNLTPDGTKFTVDGNGVPLDSDNALVSAENPQLTMYRGLKYRLIAGTEQFFIKKTDNTLYDSGRYLNGANGDSDITFEVPFDAPGLLKYVGKFTNTAEGFIRVIGLTTLEELVLAGAIIDGDNTAANGGVRIDNGSIDIKNDGTASFINFYSENTNANFVKLQSNVGSQYSGNATVTLPTSTGTLALTSDVASSKDSDFANVNQHFVPLYDSVYDLGSPTKKWRDLYLSGKSLHLGDAEITNDGSNLQFGRPIEAQIILNNSLDVKSNVIQSSTSDLRLRPSGSRAIRLQTIDGPDLFGVTTNGYLYVGDSAATAGWFHVGSNTTTQRNTSSAIAGAIHYNETDNKFELKDNTGWFQLENNQLANIQDSGTGVTATSAHITSVLQLTPLSAQPQETVGTVAVADKTNWNPASKPAIVVNGVTVDSAYPVFYDGHNWNALY